MITRFKSLLRDNRGTSAIEYGFLAAMIVIGLISAVRGVGDETEGLWATVKSKSEEAVKP
ncbi:MAG: Flp family type IVb pilin [Sphingomonadaceae bacterium]